LHTKELSHRGAAQPAQEQGAFCDEVAYNKSIPHYERIAQVFQTVLSNNEKGTGH
jgi:hypothetical protein